MAEFKLGRIRFVWKNTWATATTYYRDDVVQIGGRLYICVIGHTSLPSFYDDLDSAPAKWQIMADGQTWKGEWQNSTYYVYNDIVKFGAGLYICKMVHTSTSDLAQNLGDEIQNWDVFATGLEWKGDWAINTTYRPNEIIKYGSGTWVCNTEHLSAASYASGLENDQSKWDRFTSGIDWKGLWTPSTRYKVNDVVKYGAGLYLCNEYHTSVTEFGSDNFKWDTFVEGVSFEDEWSSTTTYQAGDIVVWGGYQYIALIQNINTQPTSSAVTWKVFAKGFAFNGEWGEIDSQQEYRTGHVVTVGSSVYVATADNVAIEPGEVTGWEDYWDLMSTGLRWRGQWADDGYYVVGDVVRYDNSSYVCIESHVSDDDDFSTETRTPPGGGAANSRPDLDITGRYWNVLAIGAETDALEQLGDLVYYGGAGPTRLPVGKEGQVLRVSADSTPEWTFFGQNPDVYYVSTTGVDQPAPIRGTTIESPWASIRYATQQILDGAKYPAARQILDLNRIYIQRETVEWTDYQITQGNSPFATNFNYNREKCERDIGFIVDAIIHDLTHGGNVKVREVALSYVNDATNFYLLNQAAETNASINFALALMEHVVNQTDPLEIETSGTNSWQVFNGDNSSAVVEQYKNINLDVEQVYARITELTNIITTAITAGDETGIPTRIETNTLIKVATGKYYEVLPIIVPAQCCVMGDELRSVTVYPRKVENGLTPATDIKYTYTALDHLENILGDISQGITVNAEVGNNEAQLTDWPIGSSTTALATTKLARVIKRFIDHGIGRKTEADFTDSYALAEPVYGYAKENIFLNRDFIKREIRGFIDDQYPDLFYSRTKCLQDVGYVIDAICYDLVYGGNWQTINAALAYYAGTTGELQINSNELTATLDSYGYLQSILQNVAINNTIINPYQTEISQIITINSANGTVSNTIFTLMNTFITIVTDVNNLPAITYPDISAAAAGLISDNTNIVNNYTYIQEYTIDFIISKFGNFTYRGEYCRRDLGYIHEAFVLDSSLQTNFWGIYTGYAYNRAQSSVVKQEQAQQELYGVGVVASEIITEYFNQNNADSTTAIQRINSSQNNLTTIFNNGDASAPSVTYHNIPGGIATRSEGRLTIINNRDYIVDFTANANSYWQQLSTDLQTKCKQDLARTLESWAFDINYDQTVNGDGCNIATLNVVRALYNNITGESVYGTSAERAASVQLYTSLATNVKQAFQNTLGGGTQPYQGQGVGATEDAKIDVLRAIITDSITANDPTTVPAAIQPDNGWFSSDIATAVTAINTAKTDTINFALQSITTVYSGFDFDHAKCSRDIGLILDAARYDWCLDTNFASIVAAYSYARQPSAKVYGYQKEATIAANEYVRILAKNVVAEQTAKDKIDYTIDFVNDIIYGINAEGNNQQTAEKDLHANSRILDLNKEFIVADVLNKVDNYHSDVITDITASDNTMTLATTQWLEVGMEVKIINTDEFVFPETFTFDFTATYTIGRIVGPTKIRLIDPTGTPVEFANDYTSLNLAIQTNYQYNKTLCTRDLKSIIHGMRWDLVYPQQWERRFATNSVLRQYDFTFNLPAYYKSKLSARYYVNSVLGSKEEDMYYLRNATGLRLQTVDGLDGDLDAGNILGTQRPTAGAYASLDPGWGPNDESVWITTRSPYVQNLTTFGHAAIGQKIDGALHNGGNDSIVSNDFTQVISDGIGAWITNNGRAELVSVFTYYSHIGYLAENGGRIRATNGNNSYGKFGSVAEGVDPDETPVTAVVDNRFQFNADISNVNVTGDEIINVEFSHAGEDYTEAQINVFGAGINADTYTDEFRDRAVNRVEITDLTGDEEQFGGSAYLLVSNTAQTGTLTSVTLAATDGNPDTAYAGKQMRIFITGGTGVGQYAIIDTYNSGSKTATVVKNDETTPGWEHLNPGTPIVSPNASSVYQIEPKITISAPPFTTTATGLSATQDTTDITWCYTSVEYVNPTQGLVVSAVGTGATFTVNRVGSKYIVAVTNGGENYVTGDSITIEGDQLGGMTPLNDLEIIASACDTTTGAILEFDQEGFGCSGEFIAVGDTSTSIEKSTDGTTWTNLSVGGSGQSGPAKIANAILYDGSSDIAVSSTIIVSQSTSQNQVFQSYDNVNWGAVALPNAYDSEPYITYGQGKFYLMFKGSRDVLVSDDEGNTWTQYANALPDQTGWVGITFGANRLVVALDNSNTIAYAEYQNPSLWTKVSVVDELLAPITRNWSAITFGANRFAVVSQDQNDVIYSLDRGESWILVDLPSDGSTIGVSKDIKYAQGQFVVIDNLQGENIRTSIDCANWELRSVVAQAGNNGYNALGFGNPDLEPVWILKGSDVQTHIVRMTLGMQAFARPSIANEKIFEIRIVEPGSGYTSVPTLTVTDPNNIYDVTYTVKTGSGVLANPTFTNRGIGYEAASGNISATASNGYAEFDQSGIFVAVRRMSDVPVAGSNVVFNHLPDQVFKLVNVVTFLGANDGGYTGFLNLSPEMPSSSPPPDKTPLSMRIRYSQVRLTGHDFLDIGTGNFASTNYPGVPLRDPNQTYETVESNGGRVFFTATDQDGNFRVGNLFNVEQSTGIATLNADAFNIAGLQELSLGEVTLGGSSATVSEFSTDPFMTADSDSVIPTQRAIKAYIEAQIGGGGASLNVNSLTAGDIFISTNLISTVTGASIQFNATANFLGGVTGIPLALNYFLR